MYRETYILDNFLIFDLDGAHHELEFARAHNWFRNFIYHRPIVCKEL